MANRYNPARDRAKSALLALLKSKQARRQSTVPSIRALAAQCGVSPNSAQSAIRELAAIGFIEKDVSGRFRFTASAAGADKKSMVRQSAECGPRTVWKRVEQRIVRDILGNVFAPGSRLPSLKELQQRYRVSYPTLQKALLSLVNRQVLVDSRRGFMVAPLPAPPASSRILAISARGKTEPFLLGVVQSSSMHYFETLCQQKNIRLEMISYVTDGDTCVYTDLATGKSVSLDEFENVLGTILFVAAEGYHPDMVLRALWHLQAPLAIVSAIEGWRMPQIWSRRRGLHIFKVGTVERPGEEAARLLLSLGHRRAAYFSPYHAALWSQARLRGCRNIFAEAGYANGVKDFCLNEYTTPMDYHDEACRRLDFTRLQSHLEQWKQHARPPDSVVLQNFLTSNSAEMIRHTFIYGRMCALFKKALADSQITAWIAANDSVAEMAYRFLSASGKPPGKDIALVAFDNTPLALRYGFTSYDFNIPAVLNAALRHVLSPPRQKAKRETTIDGKFIGRISC